MTTALDYELVVASCPWCSESWSQPLADIDTASVYAVEEVVDETRRHGVVVHLLGEGQMLHKGLTVELQ